MVAWPRNSSYERYEYSLHDEAGMEPSKRERQNVGEGFDGQIRKPRNKIKEVTT